LAPASAESENHGVSGRRHAEVAGAGFAGLAIAALLAERGWTVRVHERSEAIREIGAGIFLHNNGLLVLEELGLMEELGRRGTELEWERMRDARGRSLQNRRLVRESRVWSFPRQAVIDSLHGLARRFGVELVTSSTVEMVRPEGVLTVDGRELHADLVVGADGHRSTVRTVLGLTEVERRLPTTSIRFLLAGRDLAPEPVTTEHWSGRRRMALAASGPATTYCYMACPESDEAGSRVPLDVASWGAHFPRLRQVLERLHREEPHRSSYSFVRAKRWSAGRVVLLGDAAHALAPTLGQGTNLALSNARSLGTFLDSPAGVEEALGRWERAVRPTTDATQVWAGRYDRVTKRWPDSLMLARAAIIWAFGAFPPLNARLRRADRTPPVTDAARREVAA
jgi:2-polyprenyl-6-methoxyphenol hydroxylase-like FAD-dependent oxidoreductase